MSSPRLASSPASVGRRATTAKVISTTIVITLFAIGTNVGAPKRPLEFKRAAPSAANV